MTMTLEDLTCPSCGGSYENIVHEEKIYVTRGLEEVREDGTLVIDGQISEHDYETGEDGHLHCSECTHDWPLPAKVDYV